MPLGKGKREKPKLGPSHDFLNNVKLFEKLEKAESAAAGDPFQEKPAHRSRSRSRAKTKDSTPKNSDSTPKNSDPTPKKTEDPDE